MCFRLKILSRGSLCRWIEMMAPVFSRAAWRCVWYMIQVPYFYLDPLFHELKLSH